jgi:thymidylate synthase
MEIATIGNEADLLQIYKCLEAQGKWCSPRGESTLEIENFTYSVAPSVRFNNFVGRKLNVAYIKREMAWYVHANPRDLSIAEYAAQWGKIILNGKLNSNYGAYWFSQQGVARVVEILKNDSMSRRAVIPMYGVEADHLDAAAKDVPCTLSIEFRLRENKLNVKVNMRSQDILWGMGNDLPTFSFLQEITARLLHAQIGSLTISVGSFHVYKARYTMFKDILAYGKHLPILHCPPAITHLEAQALINNTIDTQYAFSNWLLEL